MPIRRIQGGLFRLSLGDFQSPRGEGEESSGPFSLEGRRPRDEGEAPCSPHLGQDEREGWRLRRTRSNGGWGGWSDPLALWERVRVRVFHMDLSPSLPLWGPEPSSPLWETGNPLALWERVRVRVAPELYQGFLEGEGTLQAARLTAKGAVPVNRPLLVVSLCRLCGCVCPLRDQDSH